MRERRKQRKKEFYTKRARVKRIRERKEKVE
jgi:hypothetical protein